MLNTNYMILFHPDAPILENNDVQEVMESLRAAIKGHDSSHIFKVLEDDKYKFIHAFTLSEQAESLNNGYYNEECHYRPLFSETTQTNAFLVPVYEIHGSVSSEGFVLLKSEFSLDLIPSNHVNYELIKAIVEGNSNYAFSLNGNKISADEAQKHAFGGSDDAIEAFQECNFHTIYADLSQKSVKRLNQAEYEGYKNVVRVFN